MAFDRERSAGLRFVGGRHPCLFPLASRRAGHFLLRAQEKVTKEKGTPETRPPGILPCGSVDRHRGSSTAPPVLTTNARASLPAPLQAYPAPIHRVSRDPSARILRAEDEATARAKADAARLATERLHLHSRARVHTRASLCALPLPACRFRFPLERAGCAPSGPLCRGEGAQERPEGWATGRGPVRCRRRRRRQRTPERLRAVAGQDARRPRYRGALSLGYFSLGTQREVTRSRERAENRQDAVRLQSEALAGASCAPPFGPAPPFAPLLLRCGHAKRSDPLAWRRAEKGGTPSTDEVERFGSGMTPSIRSHRGQRRRTATPTAYGVLPSPSATHLSNNLPRSARTPRDEERNIGTPP